MGSPSPFFFAPLSGFGARLEDFDMVAETEDLEDDSLGIETAVLRTERLVLRRPELGDIPALISLADNRKVAEMLARMPNPYGEAEARAFIAIAEKGNAPATRVKPRATHCVGVIRTPPMVAPSTNISATITAATVALATTFATK